MTYTLGKQPCDKFEAHLEGNPYGVWANVHECFGPYGTGEAQGACRGTVSWCKTCGSDHHSGPKGWDSCPE